MKLYSCISLTGNSAPRFYFLVATNNYVEFSLLTFHYPLFIKHLKVRSRSFANFISCLVFLPAHLKVGGIRLGFRTRCSQRQAEYPPRSHSCFQGLSLLICEMRPIPPARVPSQGCQEGQMRFMKVSLHTSWVPSTTMIPLSPSRKLNAVVNTAYSSGINGNPQDIQVSHSFFCTLTPGSPHTRSIPPLYLLAPACLLWYLWNN